MPTTKTIQPAQNDWDLFSFTVARNFEIEINDDNTKSQKQKQRMKKKEKTPWIKCISRFDVDSNEMSWTKQMDEI